MVTIYRNPSLDTSEGPGPVKRNTTGEEPDTEVPPKAGPVLQAVTVNGVAVPEEEILAEAQNHPAERPGLALRAAAQALVVRELLWQEAQRLDIGESPQPDEKGRLETRRDAAIRELIDREVQVPTATEEESRRYYDRHPEKFRSEPLFEARHILIAAPESDAGRRAAARERAEALCGILVNALDRLSELAREYSDCPSRAQGGSLGQVSRGSTVAEFQSALERMREGEVTSNPVESRFGFHIVALDRRIEGRQLPFEAVRERISVWLEASSWSRAVSQFVAILAGKSDIRGIALDRADGPLVQ